MHIDLTDLKRVLDRLVLANSPRAAIFDIDGTLSDDSKRIHLLSTDEEAYDSEASNDRPNAWCVDLINMYRKGGHRIVFITGRPSAFRDETLSWIDHNIPSIPGLYDLHMREARGEDVIEFKKRCYNDEVKGKYSVSVVVEDRESLAKMWRGLGLICLLCNDRG